MSLEDEQPEAPYFPPRPEVHEIRPYWNGTSREPLRSIRPSISNRIAVRMFNLPEEKSDER